MYPVVRLTDGSSRLCSERGPFEDIDPKKVETVRFDMQEVNPFLKDNIEKYSHLKHLYLNGCKLTSLEWLYGCESLETLICSGNSLSNLSGLQTCINLQRLCVSRNELTSLHGIENCAALTELVCVSNGLSDLNELVTLRNLKYVDVSSNFITNIDGLENCRDIVSLFVGINRLASLPLFITQLPRLKDLEYSHNPVEALHIQVRRFLERRKRLHRALAPRLYSDAQNTHDSAIVKSVKASLAALLAEPVETDAMVLI